MEHLADQAEASKPITSKSVDGLPPSSNGNEDGSRCPAPPYYQPQASCSRRNSHFDPQTPNSRPTVQNGSVQSPDVRPGLGRNPHTDCLHGEVPEVDAQEATKVLGVVVKLFPPLMPPPSELNT